jgi:hypothetical protein
VVSLHEKIVYALFTVSLPTRKPIPFDRPAAYRIVVQGRVDPALSDQLEGMKIYQVKSESGDKATILEGELCDQASLVGVLNSLYELHLTVISVKRLKK